MSYVNFVVKGDRPTLLDILSGGGLLLIVSTLCASAVGELIGSQKSFVSVKIVAGGSTIFMLIFSSEIVASVSEMRGNHPMSATYVCNVSLISFVLGVLCSMGCIALSEI